MEPSPPPPLPTPDPYGYPLPEPYGYSLPFSDLYGYYQPSLPMWDQPLHQFSPLVLQYQQLYTSPPLPPLPKPHHYPSSSEQWLTSQVTPQSQITLPLCLQRRQQHYPCSDRDVFDEMIIKVKSKECESTDKPNELKPVYTSMKNSENNDSVGSKPEDILVASDLTPCTSDLSCSERFPTMDHADDSSEKILAIKDAEAIASYTNLVSNDMHQMDNMTVGSTNEGECSQTEEPGEQRSFVGLGFEISLFANLLRDGIGHSSAKKHGIIINLGSASGICVNVLGPKFVETELAAMVDSFLEFKHEKVSDYLKRLEEKLHLFSNNWVLADMSKLDLEEDRYLKYSYHQKSVLEEIVITMWDPGDNKETPAVSSKRQELGGADIPFENTEAMVGLDLQNCRVWDPGIILTYNISCIIRVQISENTAERLVTTLNAKKEGMDAALAGNNCK